MVVSGGGKDRLHIVLFFGGHGPHALAAAALGTVLADGQPFDVTTVGQGEDALFLFNEVFNDDLVLHVLNFRLAIITEFIPDCDELVLQDAFNLFLVSQKFPVVGNLLFQMPVFLFQFFAIQALQLYEAHIADCLSLHLGEPEALHQILSGVVITGTDNANDLVNVILCDQQAFQQMGALLGLAKVITGAAYDQVFLEAQIFVQNAAQIQNLRLGLVVNQRQHIDGKAGLKRRLFKQTVQDYLGVGITLQFNDDAHAVAVGLVPQVGNAF